MKISDPDLSDLVIQGSLKEDIKIGRDQIFKFLNRAKQDIETAKSLIEFDDAAAMTLVYDSMFHSANALVRFYGFRPGKVRQHIGLIEAASRILGKEFKEYIIRFDKLRKKRNLFEYQAVFDYSKIQIENNLAEAENFVSIIEKFIDDKIE